jgi:drug/metabolite transporter (DMT)-like permease
VTRREAPHLGFLLALLAAAMFGVTTPLVQRLGVGIGPFTTAALLYAGAAVFSAWRGRDPNGEPTLSRRHLPRLLAIAACGAVVAPAALAWGLQRANGVSASLLLNLEPVFTVVCASAMYREHVGRRVWMAVLLITAGALVLVVPSAAAFHSAHVIGLVAVALATLGWALDNTLALRLSSIDPSRVVFVKGALGAAASVGLALAFGEPLPGALSALGLLACGGGGYGLSLRLYLLAQRRLGAGRTASVFGAAPFVAAVGASLMGQSVARSSLPTFAIASSLMIAGLYLHLTEKHGHAHRHDPLDHEHAHRHDDGHHAHAHADDLPTAGGVHSHAHHHDPLEHEHPHMPDAHHVHRH